MAPRVSSSFIVMLVTEFSSTTQPLFALELTMCTTWDTALFRTSCGPMALSTIPTVLPRRK